VYGKGADQEKERAQGEERAHILAGKAQAFLEPEVASDSAGNSSACSIKCGRVSAACSAPSSHAEMARGLTTWSCKYSQQVCGDVAFEEVYKKGHQGEECEDEDYKRRGYRVHEVCRCVNDSADIIRSPRGQMWDEESTRSVSVGSLLRFVAYVIVHLGHPKCTEFDSHAHRKYHTCFFYTSALFEHACT
jgi:hypothetical protein